MPDTPATDRPLVGWSPELRTDTLSLVRPLQWARAIEGLRLTPERWGSGVFRIAAPGGAHLLIRRHGAPELALWLPAKLAPRAGEPFGLYLHPDTHHAARLRAAGTLRRALVGGMPLRAIRYPQTDRLAAMLYVYDLMQCGASLHDVAERLLTIVPAAWKASSERSDLRRLAEAGTMMADHGYRSLLSR